MAGAGAQVLATRTTNPLDLPVYWDTLASGAERGPEATRRS